MNRFKPDMRQMKADACLIITDKNRNNIWGILTAWYPDATSGEKMDAIKYAIDCLEPSLKAVALAIPLP